eukprot:3009496-Amphidinium_carterae.1
MPGSRGFADSVKCGSSTFTLVVSAAPCSDRWAPRSRRNVHFEENGIYFELCWGLLNICFSKSVSELGVGCLGGVGVLVVGCNCLKDVAALPTFASQRR